jgi:NAD(P)-dependent dehydrogenase (short-subunit alcohol dehydrogenase family)
MIKTVLITGASSGLGRATAKLFQTKGWNVVATMRVPDQEVELTKLERVLVTRLDVQDAQSIDSAVKAGIESFGRIDAVVNNAGYGAYGPLEATSNRSARRQFDVNVLGVLDVIKAVLPHFRSNASGTIVNISSVGGRVAFPLGTLYHGTKFAVEGMSESLKYELAPLGIRVKIVQPGGIKTDFGGRSFEFNNDRALLLMSSTRQRRTSRISFGMRPAPMPSSCSLEGVPPTMRPFSRVSSRCSGERSVDGQILPILDR